MSLGISNAWDFQQWVENFRIKVHSKDSLDMKFDMIGIDPAIANAFRRILVAEVPTMAIEHVFYINNTSIITVCCREDPSIVCRLLSHAHMYNSMHSRLSHDFTLHPG